MEEWQKGKQKTADGIRFRLSWNLIQHGIIFINCSWVVTRWQWLFNTYTKHEIGLLLNLRPEGYMRSM
jgi:hypothetical protein